MRCLNSGCVDYTETRNNYCGRYADVTECDEMEPRNLAKPNAQPALSDGWRDARKEIPSPRKRVIVTDGNTVTTAWISATIKGTWEGWTILDNEYFDEVIAWRELPDPPAFA